MARARLEWAPDLCCLSLSLSPRGYVCVRVNFMSAWVCCVHAACQVRRSEGNIDDNAVTTFLANTTMVGLLPVPHPIVIRK